MLETGVVKAAFKDAGGDFFCPNSSERIADMVKGKERFWPGVTLSELLLLMLKQTGQLFSSLGIGVWHAQTYEAR